MLIFKQHRIYRSDLQNNPNILYIFGDNLDRVGYGGQAGEMRDEPNAFGIATKHTAGHSYKDFFKDADPTVIDTIDDEFNKLREHIRCEDYVAICIPSDGIGTGLSEMPKYAPKALDHIEKKFRELRVLFKD